MDWLLDGSLLSNSETDLANVFEYEPRSVKVVQLDDEDGEPKQWKVNDEGWKEWFHESYKPKVTVVFARRAKTSPSAYQPKTIRSLSFSHETFRYICSKLMIHSGISRTISRGDVASFCSGDVAMGELEEPAIVYHSRTSMAWDGDLALSVTHLSKTGSTNAIVFGTTAEIEDEIIGRLYCSSSALSHPFLLPGIFTELERERQLKRLVEDTQGELEKATYYLGSEEESESDQAATQPIIDLWLDTTELRNGLFNWKTQVEEMLLHIEGMAESYSTSNVTDGRSAFACADTKADLKRKQAKVNSMIRNRLRSIINEYEDTIRDCTMRLDGMSMATQLSHARTNMQIALESKRDGKRMQNISIFSMVFLPSMFVATVFSTDFFNWFPKEKEAMISPYIWVLISFCICLSILILGGYYLLSTRLMCLRVAHSKSRKWLSMV
ncbi:protein kinase [Colletotrichum scovillei]|nr:protein kinase [Colletotrichum scovillei]